MVQCVTTMPNTNKDVQLCDHCGKVIDDLLDRCPYEGYRADWEDN